MAIFKAMHKLVYSVTAPGWGLQFSSVDRAVTGAASEHKSSWKGYCKPAGQPLEGFEADQWLCFERCLVASDLALGGMDSFFSQSDARSFRALVYANHGKSTQPFSQRPEASPACCIGSPKATTTIQKLSAKVSIGQICALPAMIAS